MQTNIMYIVSAVVLALLIISILPNILASNRGRLLRNIAIWLAIMLALASFYKYFGPGSPHPLFNTPGAMQHDFMTQKPASLGNEAPKEEAPPKPGDDPSYTPPKE